MVIYNRFIPFKGFKAINLLGVIFVRSEARERFKGKDMNHEQIHSAQIWEMLVIGFYLWYVAEWLVKCAFYGSMHKAYRAISFEREAYAHQSDALYLQGRRHFAWLKYLKKEI